MKYLVTLLILHFLVGTTLAFATRTKSLHRRGRPKVTTTSFPVRRHTPNTFRLPDSFLTAETESTSNDSSEDQKATIPQLTFNLVKAIVGAGVLGLPVGIAAYGNAPSAVVPAIGLITAIGTVSAYDFALIGRVCSYTNTTSFRQAWAETVSPKTSWMPAFAVTFQTLFLVLAYSMILGDTFSSLLAGVSSTTCLLGITGFILLPLCLLKNLSSLAPFSFLGSLGMVYTALAMAIRYFGKAYTKGGQFATATSLPPSFGTVGARGALSPSISILAAMLSTAYVAHFNAPIFYRQLKDATIPRYLQVVKAGFGISIALYAIIAATGFLTFGGASSGIILNNYATTDTLMGISRIAVAISLLASYPLVFVGARDGILDLFNIKNRSPAFLNALTIAMLAGVTGLALVIPDVTFVLSFAGATLGNALIYVFPALMFRGAVRNRKEEQPEVKWAMGSAGFGLCMGILGAKMALKTLAR